MNEETLSTQDEEQVEASAENTEKKPVEGPPPEHPRFNQIYGKMKHFERMLQEREADIEAMREHNNEMARVIHDIHAKRQEPLPPEPDITEDPDGYKKWVQFRDAKREAELLEEKKKERLAMLVEIVAGEHEDYDDMIKLAEKTMIRDKQLHKQIWSAVNPARAAYKLGRKLWEEQEKMKQQEDTFVDEKEVKEKENQAKQVEEKNKKEAERKERIESSSVLSSNEDAPPPKKEAKLTDAQRRVVRNMFPHMNPKDAEKAYLDQLQAIERGDGI